ncbi:Inner membrane protein YbaN [Macrococcoides canis]|uniref:Inner membrane protein YbaN n=1 Tax=Macrococcoides canis TaxID=1855823 RepID=A0A1W7A8V4_9STAP|nr:YbaN family protein [Macrococcus canis]ARQ06083.1 Inner membrane protein YbaN [Macrococcus canis]
MKYFLITVGVVSTILGFIGAVLPLLPTTPFLLLAIFCFARSSERFHQWLTETQLYKSYVQEFYEQRGYTMKKKLQLLLSVYIVVGFSIYMIDHLYVRIGLVIMLILQTVVLFFCVKTIK